MRFSEIDVGDVAELLRDVQGNPVGCCLLLGAGVSKSAGIGLAADFVDHIKGHHPAAYARAVRTCQDGKDPTYGDCMGMLTPAQQTALVRNAIEQASVNWAHIGIALLEANGFIDAILTTNFDPLASRACALFNRFPAIYDLAGLRDSEGGGGLQFDRSFVAGSAIYHLHGQHTGFLLLNTREKLEAQANRIAPVLNATMIGKPIIVCGYSGENDPLVDRIAALGPFPHGIVWVMHNDKFPSEDVQSRLLNRYEASYVVRNMPSDKFFDQLFRALGIDPPLFLAKPFDHMLSVLDTVASYRSETSSPDLVHTARDRLIAARDSEHSEKPKRQRLYDLVAEDNYRAVWEEFGEGHGDDLSEEEKDMVSWAAVMMGNEFLHEAEHDAGDAAQRLYEEGERWYNRAITIKSDHYFAHNNFGNLLRSYAKFLKEKRSGKHWKKAEAAYRKATTIRPEGSAAWSNWGSLFVDLAESVSKSAAKPLYEKALDKYKRAVEVEPTSTDALCNLSAAYLYLLPYADKKRRGEILICAKELCERAMEVTPGKGTYNLACIHGRLGDLGQTEHWLRMAKAANDLPTCDHIWSDNDFSEVRDDPRFLEIMVSLGCAPRGG